MMILAIDWGYALLVTGMGIGTVFLLLAVLIGLMTIQSYIVKNLTDKKTAAPAAVPAGQEIHPTPEEQAAIAMAMHLYFNAHDEEPHFITIQEVERRYSPWSSKIYNMRNTFK